MIRNIIFDIGKVLVKFEWMEYIHSVFSDELLCRDLTNIIWNSGWWKELDRGVLPEKDVLSEIENEARKKNMGLECRTLLDNFGRCIDSQVYTIPWIDELKQQGYGVYYLSNYSRFLMSANPQALHFIKYMDGGVFSFEEKVMKPNEEIYIRLCQKYNLKIEECLFTDDIQTNVDVARKVGMKAIRFDGYDKTYPVIMDYLQRKDVGSVLKDMDGNGLPFDGMDWSKWNE